MDQRPAGSAPIDLSAISAAMSEAVRADDPLLGALPAPIPDDAVVASLVAPGGRAAALARVIETPVDDPLALWSAITQDVLQLRIAPDASASDVGAVLDAWLAAPPAIPTVNGDHARVVRLPAVAHRAIVPLLERGFAASSTTMARPTRDPGAPISVANVSTRPATTADRAAMIDLMVELVETEDAFGSVRLRPDTDRLCAHYVDEALGFGEGWAMVAESADGPVGWIGLSPPEHSAWVASNVAIESVAYLGVAIVTAARRSRGIGRLLAHCAHSQASRYDIGATVLDASALNTWSVPFWHRQGYRPLWTTWQRRSRPN